MHQIISSPNRLSGELTPPGDRSISVRAVILNSISSGDAEIRNFGSGADCYAAIRVLKDLGAKISKIDDSDFLIQGDSFTEPHKVLNAGNYINTDGHDYLYWAIADTPFKYANAR